MSASAARAADRIVDALVELGVRRVFTLSGNQIMTLFDACVGRAVELVHVRHEAAAVHMADAWGRLTGEVGVALLTAGPGHANALSAMYTARMAQAPVLILSGASALATRGRGAFQEMPQAELAAPVCKRAATVESASSAGPSVRAAMRLARAPTPGPVHLTLPEDVLAAVVDASAGSPAVDEPPAPRAAAPGSLEALLERIRSARRPVLVTGPAAGRGETGAAWGDVAARLGVPLLSMDSPRGLRDPALRAAPGALARADLLVLLGKPVDFALGLGEAPGIDPACRFVQIDPHAEGLAQSRAALADATRLELAIEADLDLAARELGDLLDGDAHPGADWLAEVGQACAHRPAAWAEIASPASGPLHPVELFAAVQRRLDATPDSVLICDGGEVGQWAQALLRGKRGLTNGPAGAIGAALPYAMAARAAFEDHTVVAVSGDGAFGFHLGEFETAARCELPLVFIIGNDGRWNAEHQIQLRRFGANRLLGCELGDARYDEAVAALGGHGERVTCREELEPALDRAFAAGRPACVNVAISSAAAPEFPAD